MTTSDPLPFRTDETLGGDERAPGRGSCAPPSAWSQVFLSVFTPTWGLGGLLLVCLFLPAYKGCNDETVYLHRKLTAVPESFEQLYFSFLLVWPFLFGLVTAMGAVGLAVSRDPQRAKWLWRCFAAMIITHSALLAIPTLNGAFEPPADVDSGQTSWDAEEVVLVVCLYGTTFFLLLLLPLTGRYCRDAFSAAMSLQFALAVTAAVCLSLVTPTLMFAKRFLIGGRLAVAASVFLILATLLQRLDGPRVLARVKGESPLQLSLKTALLFMAVGGLACAWAAIYLFGDPMALETQGK